MLSAIAPAAAVPMAGGSNLASSWNTAWGKISGPFAGVATVFMIVGILLVVGALVSYLWKRRNGGGYVQGVGGLIITAIIGSILCGPSFLIPTFLKLLDVILNIIKGAFG